MKKILIIGMGRFGRHLAGKMLDLGNEVMVVDEDGEIIEGLSDEFTNAQIGDCTNVGVLKALGIKHFDICFVSMGEDFQSSLVITSLLKTLGAKTVIAKANQDIQADLLIKIGADEVINPEKEIAEKTAIRYNAQNIFDYVPITGEYSIYEIAAPTEWTDRTVAQLNIRREHGINILAVKHGELVKPIPGGDYVFSSGDHIVVMGRSDDVFRLSGKT